MKLRIFSIVLLLGLAPYSATQAESITTTFAGGSNYNGNMFDVLTAGNALTITGIDVNIAPNGSIPISVYTRDGSYTAAGAETSSTGWTLQGTVYVMSVNSNAPTHIDLTSFTIAANATTGFYVTTDDANTMNYTIGDPGNYPYTFSNSDLKLTTGNAEGGLFGSQQVIENRTWNGTLYYTPDTVVPEPSSLILCGIAGVVGLVVTRNRRKRAVA